MNAPVAFKKFVTSQYLFAGLLQSFAVLVPSVILFHYGLLGKMILLPMGALFVSQTDIPGSPVRRRNALLVSIGIYVAVSLLTGLLRLFPWAVFVEIILVGMFFSLIGVYGNRARTIGTTAILIFVFTVDGTLSQNHFVLGSLYILIGGLWYLILFFLINKFRPYLILQQLLGENIGEIGHYLAIKSRLYKTSSNYESLYKELMQSQIKIREQQDILREALFKTREIIHETSYKSRMIMFIFLDGIDLFERIMTSQQDYDNLHRTFDENNILPIIGDTLQQYGAALQDIGIAIQSGIPSNKDLNLEQNYIKCSNAYTALRTQKLSPATIEPFIMLGQIINSLHDIEKRIDVLQKATQKEENLSRKDIRLEQVNLNKFIAKEDYNPQYLLNNLSLRSGTFRHSVRVTLGLLVGYIASFYLPLGNMYWILMTVVVILKPAYSISRQRNIYRMAGTAIGIVIGILLVYFIKNDLILFILTMIAMVMAYSMLQINYMIATLGITLYVIISYSLLSNSPNIEKLLLDRILDTTIGSVIAGLISAFVLPSWEQIQSVSFIERALITNKNYFDAVGSMLLGQHINVEQFKLNRKDAMIALANLSDNFQKMLSEPKRKQFHIKHYHQFVATSHLMTSYIASLSYYAQDMGDRFRSDTFREYIHHIDRQFQHNLDILHHNTVAGLDTIKRDLPENKQLTELIEKRKHELVTTGTDTKSPIGQYLSNLQSIQNIFSLIHILTLDEIKIIQAMVE